MLKMTQKNQKVRKQHILQIEIYQSIWMNLKNIFQALLQPQNSPIGSIEAQNDSKISDNGKVRKPKILQNESN